MSDDKSTSNESPIMRLFGGIGLNTDSMAKLNFTGAGTEYRTRFIPSEETCILNLTGRDMIEEDINNNKPVDELENYNYIKPSHYINENKKFTRNDGKLEVFDIIDYYDLDFYYGNILKYIVRCGKKPNESMLKDLKKALVYLEKKIKNETN